jgi:hypothetical protein
MNPNRQKLTRLTVTISGNSRGAAVTYHGVYDGKRFSWSHADGCGFTGSLTEAECDQVLPLITGGDEYLRIAKKTPEDTIKQFAIVGTFDDGKKSKTTYTD